MMKNLFTIALYFICICIFILCVIKIVRTTNCFKENFRSRQDMDDVLDLYCTDKHQEIGYNNYLGTWDRDNEGSPIINPSCSFYNCPMEICQSLKKDDMVNVKNPFAYYFDKNEGEMNRDPDSLKCISKDNPESNIYCSSSVPRCTNYNVSAIDAWYFDPSDSNWNMIKINEFMNSNGICEWRNTNSPYQEVYYTVLKEDERHGDKTDNNYGDINSATHCYNRKGLSCRMQLFKYDNNNRGSNYYYPMEYSSADMNMNDSTLVEVPDTSEYDFFRGGFVCENGNTRSFGYSNNKDNNDKVDGTVCGFIGDTSCKSCPTSVLQCYDFNKTKNDWETTSYIQTNIIENDKGKDLCRMYKVNSEKLFNGVLNKKQLSEDYLTDILGFRSESEGWESVNERVYKKFEKDNIGECSTTKPAVCGEQIPSCTGMLGSRIKDFIKKDQSYTEKQVNELFKKVINNENINGVDEDYVFWPVNFNEVYDANGTTCEHCFTEKENDKTCIDGINNFTFGSSFCFEDCPAGTEYQVDDFTHKCVKCGKDQYYNASSKKCEVFTGCDPGYYFDVTSNISLNSFKAEIKEEIGYNEIPQEKMMNYENHYYFIGDSTDKNCKPCSGNTYIDKFNHLQSQCDTCETIQNNGGTNEGIYTVNEDRTRCSLCIDNSGLEQTNRRYVVKNQVDNTYECKICKNLEKTNTDYSLSTVKSRTPVNVSTDGTCTKHCQGGNYADKVVKAEYHDISADNTYSSCTTKCQPHHYKSDEGICTACPIGTELLNPTTESKLSDCSACPSGKYNHIQGTSCKNCPTTNGGKYNPKSKTGSTNVGDCYYSCLNSNGDGTEDMSNNAVYSGNINAGGYYDFDSCPGNDCFAGWYADYHGDRSGYYIKKQLGTKNLSIKNSPCLVDRDDTEESFLARSSKDKCDGNHMRTTVVPNETYVCCKNGTEWDAATSNCICPQSIVGKNNIASNTWNAVGNRCEVTCLGDSVKLNPQTCSLNCTQGNYVIGSICSNCPAPSENSSNPKVLFTDKNRDIGINGCYFKKTDCPPGFTINESRSYWNGTGYTLDCYETESRCAYWEDASTTNVNERHGFKIGGFSSDDSLLIKPIIQEYTTSMKTPRECGDLQVNKPNTVQLNWDPGVKAYCLNGTEPHVIEVEQVFENGKYTGERYTSEADAIICCPNDKHASMGKLQGDVMKYMCCDRGSNIYISSTGVVECRNYECPSGSTTHKYVYQDTPVDYMSDDHKSEYINSNCKIQCFQPYYLNKDTGNCELKENCEKMYQLVSSDDNTGLSIYQLKDVENTFDCSEDSFFIDTIGKTCVQKIDPSTDESLQYCCASNFTYNGTTCVKEFTVCES